MKRTLGKAGFSLLELLTVIAVIAILAGLLFPVMKMVKDKAKMSGCMSNLHAIGVALQEYKLDNRRYPLAILARYELTDPADPNSPAVPPPPATMMLARNGLYPEYVKSTKGLICPATGVNNANSKIRASDVATGTYAEFFSGDSYDWTRATTDSDLAVSTYAYSWWPDSATATGLAVSDPPEGPEKLRRDFARQLKFANPDASTVVTWCMNHSGQALVLFQDGSADQIPALRMTPDDVGGDNVLWRILPKEG